MTVRRKIFHKIFAPVSLGFVLATAAAISAPVWAAEATATSSVKRAAASQQFAKAEELRAALNDKPSAKRTLGDYKLVVTAYKRVTLITPKAPEVADSLLAVAELNTEMGDRFGRSYYQAAVDSYQFLVHEYPTSKLCQEAFLRSGKLEKDQLGDTASATKTYEDFMKKYPRSARKREAQEALAELALLRDVEPSGAKAEPAKQDANPGMAEAASSRREEVPTKLVHSGGKVSDSSNIPRVRRISSAANGDTTRVTIDLEDKVQYMSARIANPDRIFFDLNAARLTPEVARGNIKVDGNLLTAVRVAQNQAGVVRVVLDVTGVKDYNASLSNNPPQLLIDLYGTSAAKDFVRTAKAHPEKSPAKTQDADDHDTDHPETAAAEKPAVVRNTLPSAKAASSKSLKSGNGRAKPDLIAPPTTPAPMRDGSSTLTRALGLKIGRIVIDAGHGGHDTGTIGPTGLMEKDLCLDVALRLGKIIQQRLPGADVVYTRSDDTFIPLEERTHIANESKADLFISIHANSSQDHAARGIETYYLNMKGSAEAMEVAARENAASQEGIHDLQDLVKKIARTEKIDESREFAEDIQDSLSKRIQRTSKTVKNRGVRKAPFVVLIGADMPSILTEISFLSNPADERLLKQPEQRQHVAEGLYTGVSSYLQSMNSVTLNLPARSGHGRHGSAPVEESRNQP
jgi:N-acetylmuramoyl-L-alanine amidase